MLNASTSRLFRFTSGLPLSRGFPLMLFVLFAGFMLLAPVDCYAGPGGEIVEMAFKSKIGRILMIGAAIIFLPLIIWVVIAEKRGISKSKKALEELAQAAPYFSWSVIDLQTRAIIDQLYSKWSTGDLTGMQGKMAPSYLQSQQDILDRWREEGKSNITELKKVRGLAPLHVIAGEQCMVRLKVQLELKDYLVQLSTDKVIKGSKSKVITDHEAIWSLVYLEGSWQLFSIEDSSESLVYARAENEINPAFVSISTIESKRGTSEVPTFEPQQGDLAAQQEKPVVEVGSDEEDQREPAKPRERTEDQR